MDIAIIGCGVIGGAFAHHFAKKKSVIVCDKNREKSSDLARAIHGEFASSPGEAIQRADVVVLAIKPKDLKHLSKETGSLFKSSQILVSALGGTSLATLRRCFEAPSIIRCLPNLPMICGAGIIGFCLNPEEDVSPKLKEKIDGLFQGLGLLLWLTEEKLEGLSALAGSGPAFIYLIIEAMIDSGVLLGFSAQEAKQLVLKTVEGSIQLLRETDGVPSELKAQVASPAGTTITGLQVLEEAGVRGILMKTFHATYQKAQEMH